MLRDIINRGTTYAALAMSGGLGVGALAFGEAASKPAEQLCQNPPAGVPPLYWLIATLGMGVATLVCQTVLEIRRGKK